MRRAFGLMCLAVLLTGCSGAADPLHSGPAGASESIPALVGQPRTAVVLYVQPRPGDTLEMLGAEPIGDLNGANIRFLLSRPVHHANGDVVIGDAVETLTGARVRSSAAPGASTGPDDQVGIVAEITATKAGRFQLTSVLLRYRVNGGDEQVREHIDTTFVVCAGDALPTTCTPDITE